MSYIEWVIKATGQIKRTSSSMESETAAKLVKFLNGPNSASIYHVVAA